MRIVGEEVVEREEKRGMFRLEHEKLFSPRGISWL